MRKAKLDKINLDHIVYRCTHCGLIRGNKLFPCTNKDGHDFKVKPINEKRKYTYENIKKIINL